MFNFFKCLIGEIICAPKEDLGRFTVLEETDYEGINRKYCELVKGIDGKCFFKPILGSDCNISGNTELPSNEGWPALVKTEEEFWELLDNYEGGILSRDSSKVSNLLNDISLNIPNSRVYVTIEKGLKLCIPDQVILDILRTDEIRINDEIIYSSASDTIDSIYLSNEMRAKLLFEKCICHLENNYKLTSNALKLLTQASMSHLGVLIAWRFINVDLLIGIRCLWQSSNIELKGDTVSITYHTNWEIVSLDGREVKPRYMKACVKISILKTDLEMSSAGNAEMIETCSPFFKSLEELLHEKSLPSEVDSISLYLKKIEDYADCYYPIDFDLLHLDIQQKSEVKYNLLEFSEKSMSSLLYILSFNKELRNNIVSIASVGLPKYVESEAKRIFENQKLDCIPYFLNKEFDFSINSKDHTFNILIKTFWRMKSLGKIMTIAVELEGKLVGSFNEKDDYDNVELRLRRHINNANSKVIGESSRNKPNVDDIVIEKATQYFYILQEDESHSWIKV